MNETGDHQVARNKPSSESQVLHVCTLKQNQDLTYNMTIKRGLFEGMGGKGREKRQGEGGGN
jgi:hypothetical protein